MTEQMFARQASTAYRNVAVIVPPLTALVMLYDGAITYLQRTIQAVEARRPEEAHNHLVHATSILRGLDHNLDFERGGACAERLHRVYNAFIFGALRASGRQDGCQSYRKIVVALTDMREAWATIAGMPPRAIDRNQTA